MTRDDRLAMFMAAALSSLAPLEEYKAEAKARWALDLALAALDELENYEVKQAQEVLR